MLLKMTDKHIFHKNILLLHVQLFHVLTYLHLWGDVLGVERDLALDEGKYLKKPLPNTTLRVANMLMNLWQMMFIPFTTRSYENKAQCCYEIRGAECCILAYPSRGNKNS